MIIFRGEGEIEIEGVHARALNGATKMRFLQATFASMI